MSATTDNNKGFDLLLESIRLLKWESDVELLVFGNKENLELQLKIPIRYFGIIRTQEKLNQLYSAADVTIVPSRSENLPNIILESFSCGTPVVAFKIGGIPDLIEHELNGYLAKPFDVTDLARGIEFSLLNIKTGQTIRDKVEKEYSLEKQASEYLTIYQSLQ